MSFNSEYLALRKKREKEKEKKKQELISTKPYASKLISSADEIAPVKTYTPTTTKKTSSYLDDGYDFGDISKTILGVAKAAGKAIVSPVVNSIKEEKAAEEKKESTFDEAMTKKYSSMSLSDLEKNYARIEKEEKEHKEKNGGKVTNYLTKMGSYIAEGMSGQSGSETRAKSQANVDKINDYAREKEILNTFRKKKATEEYLGGLDEKQLKMLDNIAEAKDLETAAPFSILAPQGGMDAATYSKITEVERTAGKESREKLYNQLKKKNPKKSDEEINELIDNMVELRRNQVNAEESSSMMLDIKGNGAASAFNPDIENKVGFATEHPVASFILSRGANLLGGVTGLSELYLQRGNEYGLDTNAPGFALTNASSAIDEQVQLDHNWKIGEVDAFDFFYKAGTGIVDNVARLAMSGGNTTLAGAMMFTQGTTQTIIEGKEKGYSDAKALTMGLLNGTFEAISEKMSLDSILGSSGGALKTLAKSFAAEGSEELTSNWLNRIADQVANGKHSDLSKMYEAYKNEGYTEAQALSEVIGSVIGEDFESFLIGGIAGAVMGGGVAISNAKQKNALDEKEQKVFDKVVEERIAEATEDGKKTISKEEEAKIRADVLRSIDDGSLDTEKIESILAPEDYEKYKKVADTSSAYESKLNEGIEKMQQRYDELQTEYDELNELDLTKAKLGDHKRYNDIEQEMSSLEEKIQQWKTELDEYKNDKTRSELETNLKTKLGQSVFDLVKDSRLAESYRRKQKFEADFEKFKGTKHEDAARISLENAVKAGVDNSKGMRTLMESNARFSANTGVVFEYTTNEQEIEDFTKEQTKAIEEIEAIPEAQRTEDDNKHLKDMKDTLSEVQSGKLVVDGTKKPGVITINLDSPKALNLTTGHEVGHLLEKAKHYKKTQDALFEYARLKGVDIKAELDKKERKYSGVKDSDPRAELFCDLVGDYLYTDYDFVVHLANNNQTAFHSLWDSIKYLYKMATAGSKEARQLEKVKRNFEKAYREVVKSGAKSEGVKHSITEAFVDENGNKYENAVLLDTDFFEGISPRNWGDKLQDEVNKRASTNPFILPITDENGNTVLLQFAGPDDTVRKNGGSKHNVLNELSYTSDNLSKLAVIHIDEIISVSEENSPYFTEDNKHGWLDRNGWLHRNANVVNKLNGNIYNLTVDIAKAEDGRIILYATKGKIKKVGTVKVNSLKIKGSRQNSNIKGILPQNSEKSRGETDYSLSDEQEAYFKDSKVRDENGNLKVMYHGTSKGGHTVFDTYGSNYGLMGTGSYFTDNKSVAESYTNKGKGSNKQVYESYLNITNPLDMDAQGNAEEWAKAFPDVDFPESGTNEQFYRAVEEFYSDQMMPKWEVAEEIRESIQFGMGYDGITHIGGGRFNKNDDTRHRVYIAFEPEQIKNIDNIAPTKDADIRYSLTEDSEGNKLTEKQSEYFKDSKAVDRNGNLLKVYHTTKNDFTVFDKARKGEATEDANTYLGFFFSDDAEYMQNFPEFENGKTESYYLDMKNPIDMTDISREAFMDIVEVMGGDVGDASILYDDELADEQNRAKLRGDNNVSLQLGRLLDELTGEFYYQDFITELKPHYDELMSKGYDGVINFMDEGYGVKEYIVLDSNQAKLTSNKNPTSDADVRYSLSSMGNTFFGDPNVTEKDFENGRYKETEGYKAYVDICVNNYRQTRVDFDETAARKSIEKQIDGIVEVAKVAKKAGYDIYDDNRERSTKDSKNRLLFSSLEPNSDYFTSSDISTNCDKRKNFAQIYDDIVKREEEMGVPHGKRFFDNIDNYFYIHKVMADKGLTQPCRQCYVESMRKNLAPMARKFLQLITETNVNNKANDQLYQISGKNKGQLKSNNAKLRERVLETLAEYEMSVDSLSVETLTTEDGLARLKIQAPLIYEAFNSFYGQSKPKMPKSATPFRFGELTALLTDSNGKINQNLVNRINATGGFRLQSYSDFQIQNYVDVLQTLFEAGTLGLSGHAYTKVPAFLDATEGTNLKRNISIFMYKDGTEWKIDKNDSFPYELNEIYDIVNNDGSGNTSIIAVSQNDDMSAWIMANDYVGYGIPFHKSGLKMGTVRDTDVKTDDGRIIKGYSGIKDHTKQQTEVWAKTTADHKAFTKVKKGINIYSFWDFENKKNLSKTKLIEKNLKAYINACEDAGYLPKFRAYVMNNDAILNKTLQYSKELGFVPQNATVEDISFKYKGYTIPYGYYKFLGDFGMFTPDGQASAPKTLSLDSYDFDKAVEFFEDSEKLHRNEILQQFANGEERAKYRNSKLTAGELADIVKQKRNEVVDSIVAPTNYSLSGEGDTSFAPADGWFVYANRVTGSNDIAPTVSKTEQVETVNENDYAPMTEATPTNAESLEETPIRTTKQKLSAKLKQSQAELDKNVQLREKSNAYYDDKIAKAQAEYDAKKNKDTKAANTLLRSIERYKRLKGNADTDYKKRISDIESRITKLEDQLLSNHDKADRLERYKKRADARLEADKKLLKEEFEQRKAELQEEIADKNTFVRNKALALYNELNGLRKGVRASEDLAFFLDEGFNWSELKSTLLKVSRWSDVVLNPESEIESIVRESIGRDYEDKASHGMDDLDAEFDKQVKQLEEEAQKKLDEFKVANQRMTKQNEYHTQMEELVGDTSTWKDKKLGISYATNTLRRNLRDVVRDSNGKRDIAKAYAIYDELQGKYNHNEAELNREETKIKQPYAEKKITKAEDAYIQMLGELRHNPETTLTEDVVKEYYEKNKKHIDAAKVDKIIEDARTMYDDLFVRLNEVLSEQGMKEIPYRKGYFPHFTEDKQGFFGKLFNWKTQNDEIPTSIAGLTEMFEPNRSWQSFNKQRKTDVTDYSFMKGLDNYVHGALDWIYHIEDIQKRRAFENYIRYTHSEDGVKEKIDAIFNSEEYDADEMQEQIDLVYREANNPLNNFIQDFHTATNTLAGKKSSFDRDLEQKTNRKIYSVMTNLSNRVSGNMVAGSVSSALTNFIPITQSWVEVSPVTSLRAMGETITSTIRDDGTIDKSDFLTNRLNKSENLYKTNWDKVGKGVSFLMEAIDNFTSQTVWRSKYIQNMSKGMSESEAIKNADQFAANVMADRSRGNQPTIFDSKSPVSKIFTAFQLEVNNQYGYFFKDAPQDMANKSKTRLAVGYATAFFGAYAYNALYSSLTGRNAAFDPIRIIEELMRDLGFGGDDDEEEEIAPVDVLMNFTNNILEEVPFIGGLLGGGRIPISSAMPYGGIMEAYEGTLQDISEGNVKTLTKEWLNPVYYLAMPMGGGQIRKTNQGLAMFSDDHPVAGSYTDSGSLRFPVEETPWNVAQAAVFGQYANKNARAYFDEGYAPLKENQIKEYAEADMPIADYWKYREGLKDLSKQDEKASYINGLDISKKQKDVLKSYLYDEEGYKEENPEKYAFLEREGIGYLGYKELDEDTQSAWSWAFKHQDEYEYYKENGVLPGDYSTYYIPMLDFEDEDDEAYSWAFDNPEKATVGKVFSNGVKEYRQYTSELNEIKADEDENGKTISGSAKEKKKAYIWSLPLDEGQKMILFRSLYDSKDDRATYNRDILDYLFSRDDLTYDEAYTICEELGFTVNRETGHISWD